MGYLLVLLKMDAAYRGLYGEGDDIIIPQAQTDVGELFRVIASLEARVRALESENASLRALIDGKYVYELTSFKDMDAARDAFESAGGNGVFGSLKRHAASLAVDNVEEWWETNKNQFPDLQNEWAAAKEIVVAREVKRSAPKSRDGPEKTVSDLSLFLIPFMYVWGGVWEYMAPFLPGVLCDSGHFSRLLNISVPQVTDNWANLYFKRQPLQYLLQHASPNAGGEKDPKVYTPAFLAADIVLFVDGLILRQEKSGGWRYQKESYDWGQYEDNIVRFLLICSVIGEIMDLSNGRGGRWVECDCAHDIELVERLNEEARQLRKKVKLHLVVDRGFKVYVEAIAACEWEWIDFSYDMPYHLNEPQKRGRKTEEEKARIKAAHRAQHPPDEVDYNRRVAAMRYINEVSVGRVKRCRLFSRVLPTKMLDKIDDFLSIAAAVANYQLQLRQESKEGKDKA